MRQLNREQRREITRLTNAWRRARIRHTIHGRPQDARAEQRALDEWARYAETSGLAGTVYDPRPSMS